MTAPGEAVSWHPFVKQNICTRWDGVGSRDMVTYYSGVTFSREVTHWIEEVGYDRKVSENGRNESTVSWRIRPLDENTCNLRVFAYHAATGKKVTRNQFGSHPVFSPPES